MHLWGLLSNLSTNFKVSSKLYMSGALSTDDVNTQFVIAQACFHLVKWPNKEHIGIYTTFTRTIFAPFFFFLSVEPLIFLTYFDAMCEQRHNNAFNQFLTGEKTVWKTLRKNQSLRFCVRCAPTLWTMCTNLRVPTRPRKPGKMRVHLENPEIWNFEKFNKYHGKIIWNLEKLGGY